jgi:preprotein translocase subunit SecG
VIYVLYFIHVVICLFLIMVVLLQQGKGADLSVFGGGSTQAAFGARGAATLLHKLTVGFFVAFIVTTMSIAMLQRGAQDSSVMAGSADEEVSSSETSGDQADTPRPLEDPSGVDGGDSTTEGTP